MEYLNILNLRLGDSTKNPVQSCYKQRGRFRRWRKDVPLCGVQLSYMARFIVQQHCSKAKGLTEPVKQLYYLAIKCSTFLTCAISIFQSVAWMLFFSGAQSQRGEKCSISKMRFHDGSTLHCMGCGCCL